MRRFFQAAPRIINFSRYCTAVEPIKPQNEVAKLTETVDSEQQLVPGEDYPVYTLPSFNFAAYVNKSETLQKLLDLGVDLSKMEKKKGFPQYVLSLDFERDIKSRIILLHDLGIPAEHYGELITKNPFFFKNSIDDLETRIFYLRSKNFSIEQVRTIVIKDPFWLNFSTERIDRRLGWFQKNFHLTGDDVRFVVTRYPRLFTSNMLNVREMMFTIKEEMGFDQDEVKVMLMASPKIFMRGREATIERFNYAHNVMKFSHEKILKHPQILNLRLSRMKSRHGFLKLLKRDQFDETKPLYVSVEAFCGSTDENFVTNICGSTMETYDNFLKTL